MDTNGTTEAINQDRRRLLGTAAMGVVVASRRACRRDRSPRPRALRLSRRSG